MLSLDKQAELRQRYRRINPGWNPATEVFAELVRRQLTESSLLVDLGCGRGGLVEQLEHPLSRIIGLDPDFRSLVEHRMAGARPSLTRLTARSDLLPLAPSTVDLIYASWVLEHLEDPAAVMAEVRRILKPGGYFIFITPNRRHPLVSLNRIIARAGVLQETLVHRFYGRRPADTFPAYYRANSAADIVRLSKAVKMRVSVLDHVDDPTYLAFSPILFKWACRLERRLSPDRRIHLVGSLQKEPQ